MINYLMQC